MTEDRLPKTNVTLFDDVRAHMHLLFILRRAYHFGHLYNPH